MAVSKTQKMRVYELSKQLDMSNKDLIALIQKECNVALKSHSSTIEADVAEKIIKLKQDAPTATKKEVPQKAEVKKPAPAVEEPPKKQAEPAKPAATSAPTSTPTRPAVIDNRPGGNPSSSRPAQSQTGAQPRVIDNRPPSGGKSSSIPTCSNTNRCSSTGD